MKYNILQLAPQLDLGGTEKALQLYSENLNKDIFNVIVCGWKAGGVRAEQLKQAGFKVYCTNDNKEELIQLMQDENIHIVHIHRSGFGDDYSVEAAHKAGVPVIFETNVFGRVDNTPWGQYIDCHLFISNMCAMRYKHWTKISTEIFNQRHRVLYYPIDLKSIDSCIPNATKMEEIKKQLHIPSDAPVVGRIGRPVLPKWPPIKSFNQTLLKLVELIPSVKIALMGAPPELLEGLSTDKNLREKIIEIAPSPDPRKVFEFYVLIDVLLHSSKIGESFGMVIGEAMACSKPVVSRATPLNDNAQVELIDHGINGYIVYDDKSHAEATADLLSNKSKCTEMGTNARKKVADKFEVNKVVSQLENLYFEYLNKKDKQLYRDSNNKISKINTYGAEFDHEYKLRLRNCWGEPDWLKIFSYEHIFRHYFAYSFIRKIKKLSGIVK